MCGYLCVVVLVLWVVILLGCCVCLGCGMVGWILLFWLVSRLVCVWLLWCCWCCDLVDV